MAGHIPKELKYTPSHEWVKLEDDGTVTIGITAHAQSLLGDIVYVELPDVQKKLSKGEGCGVVESVKAAADVYAPVAGEVIKSNEALSTQPELMNIDPYGDGWLCRLKLADSASLDALLDADGYLENISEESH
jgi:glycine cleavage system H protein